MIAQFSDNEIYIDANHVTYGIAIGHFRDAVVRYMRDVYTLRTGDERQAMNIPNAPTSIAETVNILKNGELYVDHMALAHYLHNGGDEDRFIDARQKVATMFDLITRQRGSELVTWVDELRGAAAYAAQHGRR